MKSLRILILSALCAAVAIVAEADVKDTTGTGFTLENATVVRVDAATAWQALVDEVGQWWSADHTWWGDPSKLSIEPRAGGCFCEIDGERQARHLTVVFVDPGKTLRLTGGLGPLQGMGLDGVMEWRLAPAEEGGTRITLFYRAGGYTPDDLGAFASAVDGVQREQLQLLAAHLANGKVGGRSPATRTP